MKRFIAIIFSIICTSFVFGQIKQYSGKISLNSDFGILDIGRPDIKYSYTGDHIKNGPLSITGSKVSNLNGVHFEANYSLKTTYKNGRINGPITIQRRLYGYRPFMGRKMDEQEAKYSLNGNFINGKPHGKFTCVYPLRGSGVVNYNKGYLTGMYKIDILDGYEAEGMLDSKGRLTGEWNLYGDTYFFNNGVLIPNNNDDELLEISKKYALGQVSEKEIKEKDYLINTYSVPLGQWASYLFLGDLLAPWKEIGGYDFPGDNRSSYYIKITRVNYLSEKDFNWVYNEIIREINGNGSHITSLRANKTPGNYGYFNNHKYTAVNTDEDGRLYVWWWNGDKANRQYLSNKQIDLLENTLNDKCVLDSLLKNSPGRFHVGSRSEYNEHYGHYYSIRNNVFDKSFPIDYRVELFKALTDLISHVDYFCHKLLVDSVSNNILAFDDSDSLYNFPPFHPTFVTKDSYNEYLIFRKKLIDISSEIKKEEEEELERFEQIKLSAQEKIHTLLDFLKDDKTLQKEMKKMWKNNQEQWHDCFYYDIDKPMEESLFKETTNYLSALSPIGSYEYLDFLKKDYGYVALYKYRYNRLLIIPLDKSSRILLRRIQDVTNNPSYRDILHK